jgi:hypothetical protein
LIGPGFKEAAWVFATTAEVPPNSAMAMPAIRVVLARVRCVLDCIANPLVR